MPADLQAALATLGPKWGMQKLVDIDDKQARDDLARLSSATLTDRRPGRARQAAAGAGVGDRAGRERGGEVPDPLARGGRPDARCKAIDTYWISAAEHGLNASTFTARIAASTGADCAAALSSAVGALSGPLHGGAPARVLPMIDGAASAGDPEALRARACSTAASGSWASVIASTAPTTRARPCCGAPRWSSALRGSRWPPRSRRRRSRCCASAPPTASSRRTSSTGRRSCSTSRRFRADLTPAMFGCARVAGWSAHILEQKRTGRLIRPVGPLHRAAGAPDLGRHRVTLADAAAQARRARRGGQRARAAQLRAPVGRASSRRPRASARLPRACRRLPRGRPVPLPHEEGAAAPRPRRRRARPCAARRCSRSRSSRATIPATSTTSGRCCTRSLRTTTTRPCAGSRWSR